MEIYGKSVVLGFIASNPETAAALEFWMHDIESIAFIDSSEVCASYSVLTVQGSLKKKCFAVNCVESAKKIFVVCSVDNEENLILVESIHEQL